MEYLPVKTRVLQPPQDDLLAVLDASLSLVMEQDVLLVTSKVVAIDEGRCVPTDGADVTELITDNAERVIGDVTRPFPLTVQFNAFSVAASIDESNSSGFYTLPPQNPTASAKRLWEHVRQRFGLRELGVVIADSTIRPFRNGVTSYAIGWWGFEPVIKHAGEVDLFGRPIAVAATNVVDALAAGAGLVWGETAKSTPLVIARGHTDITFSDRDTSAQLSHPLESDVFYPLLKNIGD